MPIYEYECMVCDKHIDVLQKHDDPAPECDCRTDGKKTKMTRLISATNFELKGNWFKTKGTY